MLQQNDNMVHLPQDHQLPIEEMTSPLNSQRLEFCESELFPETVQISEVGSSSNCCYEEQSSHSTGLSHTQDYMNKFNGSAEQNGIINTDANNTVTVAATTMVGPANNNNDNNNNLSVFFFDSPQEDDISRSIDFIPDDVNFSVPPHFLLDGHFDMSLLNGPDTDGGGGSLAPQPLAHQFMAPPPPQPAAYEEECLSSVPSYVPSCSLLDPTTIGNYLPPGNLPLPLPHENSGIFTTTGGSMFLPQELDGGRFFCPDTMSQVYNFSTDLQKKAVSSESQHLVSGAGSSSTPLASDITSLEDSTFKVGKLSVEQRKEKIHRYMKKRNERNFSKKIKYACRKTLADSRPRVRGRFAKNDELAEREASRTCLGTPDEDMTATNNTEDVRMSLLYDPNHAAAATAAAAAMGHNGRIFAANCLPPPTNPYDMCTTTLYCTDSQMG